MTKQVASSKAGNVAKKNRIDMVVTYNPYSKWVDGSERYDYHPASSHHLFSSHEIVKRIAAPRTRSN